MKKNKKTYSVTWQETVTYRKNVIASSEEEAIDIAQCSYSSKDEIETQGCDLNVEIV